MTDHKVSDFVSKKSYHAVTLGPKYLVKATSDTVSVGQLLLFQQLITVGADVLKYELCVYSPVLFEAPCCNPSSKCHTGMSTTFRYSNPAGCQLHLWLRWSDPQNSMENCADLWVTVWKIYTEYVKNEIWPTKVLFDGHPGGSCTKNNSHLRSKKSSGSNSSYLKEAT